MHNRIKYTVLLLIILIIGFAFGFVFGTKRVDEQIISQQLINTENSQVQNVDFSLFWDVWKIIDEKYVDHSELDKQNMLYGAIEGLVASLGDPHTVFLRPTEAKQFNDSLNGEFAGIGIEIGIRNKKLTVIAPLKDTPADIAGIKSGDIILQIDGENTDDIQLFEAVEKIRGKKGTVVTLQIMRNGFTEPELFSMTRNTITIPAVQLTTFESPQKNIPSGLRISHLQIFTFNQNVDKEFSDIAKNIIDSGSNGIILDLRNNPGGLLDSSINIASYFLDDDLVVVTEKFGDDTENVFKTNGNKSLKEIPIVILINSGSASASEILAGALRDHKNVTIIGETSFGKGSVQQVAELQGKTTFKYTVAKWLTPNGTSINEQGIEPDVVIERTADDIDQDRDPQLDKAVELLLKMM